MPDIATGIKQKRERPKSSPPTLADLKAQGVTGVRVSCVGHNFGHYAVVSFELIRVADGTPFPALRFKCSRCGNRDIQAQPVNAL
jgi:hypothetical protein